MGAEQLGGYRCDHWRHRTASGTRADPQLNRDNVPLPPQRRSWGFWSYTAFWVTSGVSVSGWAGGASFLGLGLTISQTMIVCIIGNIIVSCMVVLTGQMGAYWHVGFPMWNRMVWGMRLAYFPLLNRIIVRRSNVLGKAMADLSCRSPGPRRRVGSAHSASR